MTRMVRSVALAAGLLLVVAAPVAAAQPEIVRDSGGNGLEIDWTWSDACGAEIWSKSRFSAVYQTFSDGRGSLQYSAERTIVGPSGTVLRRTGQSFGGTFTSVEDPDAGTVTESFHSVAMGAHRFLELGGGRLFQEVGLYVIDATIVWGPGDDVSITVHDEYANGQRTIPEEEAFIATICGVLV